MIVGPNGAGKTTFFERVLRPVTHLEFVNADVIAAEMWPDEIAERAYEAAAVAAERRAERFAQRRSFATETGRMFTLVGQAVAVADEAAVYDNSKAAHPFRPIATFVNGHAVAQAQWPAWTPPELVALAPPL